jgi:hypothetical protein
MASQPTTVMTMPMLMVPMAPIIGTASNDEQIGAGQRLGVDTGLLERELFKRPHPTAPPGLQATAPAAFFGAAPGSTTPGTFAPPTATGTGGRNKSESVAALVRNHWPLCLGTRIGPRKATFAPPGGRE